MSKDLYPIKGRIIVKPDPVVSPGGIVLPEGYTDTDRNFGTIVAIADEEETFTIGQRLMYYPNNVLDLQNGTFLMETCDILALER